MSDEHPAAERPALGISARPSSAGAGGGLAHVTVRHAKPSDYGRVIGRINVWWGGRDMAPMLPKLFFIHFEGTSFIAEREDGELAGFVCGFLSQTEEDEAYIHFVGVDPEARGDGLGRALYERFFEEVRGEGRTVVRCVTSPLNRRSVDFHEALGFEVDRVVPDYDGPGEDRVLLVKRLT
jgi:ribosomal protein S18 acetylase RimI-like enzyme